MMADSAAGAAPARLALLLVAFVPAYFLAAKLGIATSMPPRGIVVLWPPNAILLAFLLAVRPERWWLFFVATVATEIFADVPDYPLWSAAGYGIVNFSEAALAAFLLSRFGGRPLLGDMNGFVRFLAIGPVLASGTAALFGAAIYKIGDPAVDYLHYWRVFWLGDATGLLVVGTALLAWNRPADAPQRGGAVAAVEAAVLSLAFLAVSGWALAGGAEVHHVYLIFPLLMWAALRFGVRGASLATVTVAAIAIGAAVRGYGPFVELSRIDAVISLQGLIAVVALSTFMLAFATESAARTTSRLQQSLEAEMKTEAELRTAYATLEKINRDLDAIVADRTSELSRTLARNEMLLREVHHRVKNNLQLVSSLVAIHSRSPSVPDAVRGRFAELQRQVRAIAATYDVLQKVASAEVVDFGRIVSVLCQDMQKSGGELVTISIGVGGGAMVPTDGAVALSLALNELVTNSIKHAGGERATAIAVSCRRDGDTVMLRVADDGPGFPPGFDLDRATGFGMQMARAFVNQAGGRMRIVGARKGAVVEILAPAADAGEAEAN